MDGRIARGHRDPDSQPTGTLFQKLLCGVYAKYPPANLQLALTLLLIPTIKLSGYAHGYMEAVYT